MTTEHSRKLRSTTATNWNKVAREQGRIAQITMSGDATIINEIRTGLSSINEPGLLTNAQKVSWLINQHLNSENPPPLKPITCDQKDAKTTPLK